MLLADPLAVQGLHMQGRPQNMNRLLLRMVSLNRAWPIEITAGSRHNVTGSWHGQCSGKICLLMCAIIPSAARHKYAANSFQRAICVCSNRCAFF